ncbi:DegT/DnrJ/EryC1/StrS family aminotransferase [Nitrobacter winogradskyi]|nr:DegT/DnrJ/EryC1/StrS family aminotransferase [Nitrobacter winogradskyi]
MTETIRIPWARPKLFGNEEAMVVDALRSAWISGGPYVQRLERAAAERMQVAEAVAVANGTVALELALRGLGIGPGDEVIVPGFTFVAAANMVLSVGATPLYADIDSHSWLLDPDEIDRLATPRTKAVLPVHLYGNVADMDAITSCAKAHHLAVLEDAAEAAFSRFDGKCAGTMGSVGTFSLHATKTITTGEGGLVVTNDRDLARRMRVLRDHGMRQDKRYWHDVVGYNFRLTNLQAAIGCAQLEHLDDILADRRRIHALYRDALQSCPGIRLQHFMDRVDPVLWVIAVLIEDTDLSRQRARRDRIMAAMLEDGIETRPGFYALSLMAPYGAPDLPHALAASAGVISLPTFLDLTGEQIGYICDRFCHHIRNAG